MTEQYNAILEILNTDGSDIDDIVKIMKDKYEFNIELDTKPMITKIDPITGEKLIVRQYKKYVSSQKFIRRHYVYFEIESIINSGLDIIIINLNKYDINFMYYYLNMHNYILSECIDNNPKKFIMDLEIPNIKIEFQKEIVEVLNSIFKMYNIKLLHYSYLTKQLKLFDLLLTQQYELFTNIIQLIYRLIELEKINDIYLIVDKYILNKYIKCDIDAINSIRSCPIVKPDNFNFGTYDEYKSFLNNVMTEYIKKIE
jgi:hypothetical protein